MKMLLVSNTCSNRKNAIIEMEKNIKHLNPQQKFFDLIIKGLVADKTVELECITALPVSASSHKRKIWQKEIDVISSSLKYIYVGFYNGKILRFITSRITAIMACRKWLRRNRSESDKIILCDPLLAHCSSAAVKIAKRAGCKCIAIVTDIPQYISDIGIVSHGKVRKFLQDIYNSFSSREMSKYDAYILLTEQMNGVINIQNKPYLVIEGCADINMVNVENRLEEKEIPQTILYAGGIHEKFGVGKLARAFSRTSMKNFQLKIYGTGEHLDSVLEVAEKDGRVQYMGVLPAEEIVKREMAATLLVNPRPSKEEFTKYSFPSKTTEYMASGTPMLSTRLPGIPEEYENYILWFDGETEEEMMRRIEEVCMMGSKKLHGFGKKAKTFLLNEKSNITQARKIIDFVESVLG